MVIITKQIQLWKCIINENKKYLPNSYGIKLNSKNEDVTFNVLDSNDV